MKKIFKISFVFAFVAAILFSACKKEQIADFFRYRPAKPVYSSLQDFRQGIAKVGYLAQEYHIYAYLDTLPNGLPDIRGRRIPLTQYTSVILEKLNGNEKQIQSAVYDVFHFDGATFSLISFLMKAQMVNDISYQTLVYIIAIIPLPPIPVDNFDPPQQVDTSTPEDNCCDHCNPSIKIKVTWVYKPPCGNREQKFSGYYKSNKLTHMDRGQLIRFDAEVEGCDCPGTWSFTVNNPPDARFGYSSASPNSVNLISETAGTYTITFTYKVCDKTVTQTFTVTYD